MQKKIAGITAFTLFLLLNTLSYSQFRVVGYFPNWADMNSDINNLVVSRLTHINWAFQNPDASGNFIESDNGLDKLVTKAHAASVKVLVSLGGGAASSGTTKNNYYSLISSESSRGAFIHKIMLYVKAHNLQGVDVDFEGPAINSNYGSFIKQLYDTLHPKDLLLTAALNGEATDAIDNSTIPYFDWINIMSYDATGSWTPNNPGQHSSYEYAETGISTWSARGAKKDQLVVGVPFYGHAFRSLISMDYDNYNVIIKTFPDAYLKDQEGDVIYYNGIPTIQKKTFLAMDKASGIMIWALSYDTYDDHSLLKAIDDAVKSYNPNDLAPVVTLISPAADTTIHQTSLPIRASVKDADGIYTGTTLNINSTLADNSTLDAPIFNVKNLSNGVYTISLNGTDHQNRTGTSSFTLTVTNAPRTAFNGTAVSIPGKIEAENYDAGGSDLTFKDNTATNDGKTYRFDAVDIEGCNDVDGGYDVGWIAAGEWLDYSINVASAGVYVFEFRVASPNSDRKFHVTVDGIDKTGLITVPLTGGWQTWQTVKSGVIDLGAGDHVLRVVFDAGDFNFNFNYINVAKVNPTAITGIEGNSHKVYPNPCSDFVFIESDQADQSVVEITDMLGRSVNVRVAEQSTKQIRLDFTHQASGIYLLNVKSSNGSTVLKVLKQ